MSLTVEQVKWVEDATGVHVEASKWQLQNESKAQLLAEVRGELDLQKKELQELLKFVLKMKDSSQISSSLGDKRKDWAADDELDTVHDVKNLGEALPDDVRKRVTRAIDVLNGFSGRLEKGGFSDKEIRIEFWDPLKREGICPDNFIPDRFNETVQVYRESDKLYKQRQEAEAQKKKKNPGFADAKFGIDKSLTIVSSLNSAFGGPEWVTSVADYSKTIGKATVTVFQGFVEKDCMTVADTVGEMLKETIKFAGVRDDKLAVIVQKAYSLTLNAAQLGKAAKEGDSKEFVRALSEAIGGAFAMADGGNKVETPWTTIGERINLGIQSAVDLGAAGECLKKRDWAGLTEVAQGAVSRSISAGLKDAIEKRGEELAEIKKGKAEGKGEKWSEQKTKLMGTDISDDLTDKIDNVVGEKGPLASAFGNLKTAAGFEEIEKEIDAKENKKLADELAKELDPDNHDFEKELTSALEIANMSPSEQESLGKEAREKAENSIEAMIQKIEKVRATLKIAEAVFDTGMKTAAEFFEPLKMASAGKDFAKNMILAVKQAVELNEWIDEVESAATAASVYGKAFANRVKNLKVQISEKTAHAICDLLKIIGGGLVCGVVSAPAGIILGKVGTAAQAGSDALFELGKRVDARNQWNKYRECLALPPHMSDRKLMREILHGNPTLSKYAMAYGALIEKDRIAISGMKLCGISEANLNEEGSNVKLVVKYLETKFDEDPVLVKQLPEQSWQTKSEELSLTTFQEDLDKAVDAIGYVKQKLGAIEGAFGRVAVVRPKFTEAREEYEELRVVYDKDRGIFDETLTTYHATFETYDTGRKFYAEAFDTYTDLKKQEATRKEEEAFQTDFRKAVEVLQGFVQTLTPKAENCKTIAEKMSDTASQHHKQAEKFLGESTTFVGKRDALTLALRRLDAELKKYAPLKKVDDEEHPDESVSQYLQAQRQKVKSLLDDAEQAGAGAASSQEELTQLIAERDQESEVRSKRFQALRTTLEQLTKLSTELA